MYPDTHTPPLNLNSVNHPQPRHPRGHVCLPAPETHALPTNIVPPTARAAALQSDNPETYTKGRALDQPMALDRWNHPQTLRW